MALDGYDAIDLVLMTAGYWAADRLIRRDGVVHAFGRLWIGRERGIVLSVCAALAVTSVFWPWPAIAGSPSARLVAGGVVAFLTWKAVTRDIDPVLGDAHALERMTLVACAIGTWWSPAFAVAAALLLTTPFALWEHHATLPMRVLLATVAFAVLVAAAAPFPQVMRDASILFWFALTIEMSHYVITALAKGWLGPKWSSWHRDNRLHHLAASAYAWGWMRFLPWSSWRKVVHGVRRFERPMQGLVFLIEALAPLALLHQHAAIAMLVMLSCFHVGVFALSGLLFWDWILTNLTVALGIGMLPEHVVAQVFGPIQTLAALVFTAVFPLRHKLWRPMPLGWWDTPFTQRIHWVAHGKSGKAYGLYANFWCPHERLFGKVNACYLAPVPVMTYHLGEVWKHELRDAIRNAGPDNDELDAVREQFGIEPRSPELTDNHVSYIRRLFHELNHGAKKHVLPSWLRVLKAPGGQCFYWGELPPFRGQERTESVTLHYREEYYDGERIVRLRDEQVLSIPIDASCANTPRVRPPTPKMIDDLLLEHGRGKLIDLPSFGDGSFVQADDGKVRGNDRDVRSVGA